MSSYSFEDLEVYEAARRFRQNIFALIKKLPVEEKYDLVSQMRRAATSLTNNIAEGHGRFHYQVNIQFLRQSRGSLEEILDDLNICLDESYFKRANSILSRQKGGSCSIVSTGTSPICAGESQAKNHFDVPKNHSPMN